MQSLRSVALASLALLLAAGTSPAGDRDARADVRRDVQRALAVKEVPQRTDALEAALRGADTGEAAEAVLDLVFTEDAPQLVLGVGVRALGRMESSGAEDAVTRALLQPRRLQRVLAAEALGGASSPASRQQLVSLARTDDPRVRAAAVTALGDRRDAAAFATLAEALDDPEWTVRSAAARGLRILGDVRAVPLLAARMRKEDGRLIDDLVDALGDLTGKRLGPEPDAYERAVADPGRPATAPPPPWVAPVPTVRTPLFETRSRRLLFVLSVAETMKDPVNGAAADAGIVAGIARAGDDLARELAAAKTKMDVARTHLRAMLRGVADGAEFDVMAYSGSPVFAFGDLTRADDASRKRAEARVARLTPGGSPNLRDAFHRIFDPRAKDALDAPDGPDTVVMLTDGALPTQGFNDRSELGPREARWNRARQIRFVVVSVGQSDPAAVGRLSGGPPPGLSLSIP